MTTSSNPAYPAGTIITGKWRKSRFVIRRVLGQGANGIVYLVQKAGYRGLYALKMGYDTLDLQSEINVLTSLQSQRKSQDLLKENVKSPFLLEVDDFKDRNKDIPFYVMRYIEGSALHLFIRKRGSEWIGLTGLRLLEKLRGLHQMGFVFGDLKPENVLVSEYGRVELIDYGGVSTIGRSVKQFTEWYDRGYWNAGSRTGDEAYDLFAFAILMIQLLDEQALKEAAKQQLPQTRNTAELLSLIQRKTSLKPYSSWLRKAVLGEFANSQQALMMWKEQIYAPAIVGKLPGKTPRWLKSAFAFSIVILCFAVCLAFFL
ncbi:serine/threonine protein kinase [Paenibacillus pini]|uniref:Serine/threonine-protein kinase YabT n=1 Tax=Paenibacillus pini JCM 16418 TaxID=1236976 RepID=W7YI80_9BACL|nr:serine/threonine protein kinase [Paenibacillus pini]GAF10575.1 serine/threonine-protein kinase YabT [Paenibacillus pini JCM 16418]